MSFKVNDRVRVFKRFLGGVYWNPEMDKFINHDGIITGVYGDSVTIKFDDIEQGQPIGQSKGWYFPKESIVKIENQLMFNFMYE